MKAVFRVTYFDPVREAFDMEAFNVLAANANQAIKVADRQKSFRYFRPKSVELIAVVDDE